MLTLLKIFGTLRWNGHHMGMGCRVWTPIITVTSPQGIYGRRTRWMRFSASVELKRYTSLGLKATVEGYIFSSEAGDHRLNGGHREQLLNTCGVGREPVYLVLLRLRRCVSNFLCTIASWASKFMPLLSRKYRCTGLDVCKTALD